MRTIEKISQAPEVMMGPIKLRQAFPVQEFRQISPFILLHHFDFEMNANENKFSVPAHPHRGFCPITFMYDGSVEHNDSLGNNEVINDMEVQWINAARGIIHSEITGKDFLQKGGRFQGIQLWINLKSEDKMKAPSYLAIRKNDIALIEKNGVELRVISGIILHKKGPANFDTITATLVMKTDGKIEFDLPENNNSLLYILEGNVKINGNELAEKHHLVHFKKEAGKINIEAISDAKILIMSGEEINEPLVSHGPFVMNTETEILEAMRDYEQGKMGYLY